MTDGRTDGQTDGRTEAIAISPTLFVGIKTRMRVSSTLLLKKNHSIQLENFRYQLLYYINSCLRVIPMLTIPASRNWKSCLGTLFPTIYDFGSMQISDTVLYK